MVFCRLNQPTVMADLSEVALPTRFIFLALSPMDAAPNAIWEMSEMGRSLGSMLGDKVVFNACCYINLQLNRNDLRYQFLPCDCV